MAAVTCGQCKISLNGSLETDENGKLHGKHVAVAGAAIEIVACTEREREGESLVEIM